MGRWLLPSLQILTCIVLSTVRNHQDQRPQGHSTSTTPRATSLVTSPNLLTTVSVSASNLWVRLTPGPSTSFQTLSLMLEDARGGAELPLGRRPLHTVRVSQLALGSEWEFSSSGLCSCEFPKARGLYFTVLKNAAGLWGSLK